MERRAFVKSGLGGAAVGLMGASAAMAEGKQHKHAHAHGKKVAPEVPVISDELRAVADTAYECVRVGTACIAECNRVLATGDGDMAECQEAVFSMVTVVESMAVNATMAFPNEALLKQLAKVCGDFCDYCAEACEPHAEHYAECKNCMNRCRECSDACAAYVKA